MDSERSLKKYLCRVCGYINQELGSVKSARCAGCGIGLGVEDQTPSAVKSWRHKWLTHGAGPVQGRLASEER